MWVCDERESESKECVCVSGFECVSALIQQCVRVLCAYDVCLCVCVCVCICVCERESVVCVRAYYVRMDGCECLLMCVCV